MVSKLVDSINPLVDLLVIESLYALVVLVVVLALTTLLRRRGPAVHVALWSLVFIRLVLPPDLSHPLGAGALLSRFTVNGTESPVRAQERHGEARFAGGVSYQPAVAASGSSHLHWERALTLLWCLGFLGCFARLVRRRLQVSGVLRDARPVVDSKVLAMADRWRRRLRIRRPVRVVMSDQRMAPFTVGVARPVIYLPAAVIGEPRCLEAVIAHEMAHVARFDALWLGLQHLVQAVYFFNPLVWISGVRLNDARERLCDATVVAAGRLAAREYAGGLLNVLRLDLQGAGAPTMTARKRRIGVRILGIIAYAGGQRPRVGAAVVLMMSVGMFVLPMGDGDVVASPMPANGSAEVVADDPPATAAEELVNPLPDSRMTWNWGPNHRDPFTGGEVFHRGVDLAAKSGTPVVAPADGVVLVATDTYEPSQAAGTVVIIDHGNGLTTFHAHLEDTAVVEGQNVTQGQTIATVGSTGKSTGPHLHFEVRRDGEAVDPAQFVAAWRD